MKIIITFVLASITFTSSVQAQGYEVVLNPEIYRSVSIKLTNASVVVTGTINDALTISRKGADIKSVNDSTCLGLKIFITGNVVSIEKTADGPATYIIAIPKQSSLTIEETFGQPQTIEIRDMEAAVNVHSWVSAIHLNGIKGIVTAKSEAADIIAVMPTGLNQPYSLVSVGRMIDITIPIGNTLTLDAEMAAGRLISDERIFRQLQTTKANFVQTAKGPINGGGVLLTARSHTLVLH